MNNIDTNVILRVGTNNVRHPQFVQAVALAEQGGTAIQAVAAEVFFVLRNIQRVEIARLDAIARGVQAEFDLHPRMYALRIEMPSGWVKEVYRQMRRVVGTAVSKYPIEFEDYALVQKTIDIGEEFGFDWVDSLLLARYDLYGEQPLSCDKNIEQGMKVLLLGEEEDGDSPDVDSMHLV